MAKVTGADIAEGCVEFSMYVRK
eukprot:COSAG02_NODE_41886_length_390_cov_0.529210_1_plen_23_part_10